MTDLDRALRDFVLLFEKMGAPYAIMGGLAVRVHGIPRATYDVDFTLAIERARLPDLYEAVDALGYTVPEEYRGGWVDSVSGMPLVKFRLYLEGRGVDLDVFLAESSFQQQLLSRRRSAQLGDIPVWIVSPEDLILLKLLAFRPRDIADIGDILFVQGKLDEDYMRRWADELGVRARLEDALAARPGS